MDRTRVVRLVDVVREPARNENTIVVTAAELRRQMLESGEPAELFNQHQRLMYVQLEARADLGVMVFAVMPRSGIVGSLWLRATTQLRSGTLGRHNSVDLYLPGDGGLSLRQSVVFVHGVLGVPRVRIVDLRSSTGFHIGSHGPLHAVAADGPFAMNVGRLVVFVLPTGMPPPWNPEADDAWSTLPSTKVAETACMPTEVRQWCIAQLRPGREGDTVVQQLLGPAEVGAEPLLQPGEQAAGALLLSGAESTERLEVGLSALERGVILGRNSRCSGAAWASPVVSRVHALVILHEGVLHVVDTGSSNGVWLAGREVLCSVLRAGDTVRLAREEGLELRWEPSSQ